MMGAAVEGKLAMLFDAHHSAAKLRDLAHWYRAYAEQAGNPAIWSSRLATAEDLERRASDAEHAASPHWSS
jgi:hypothetical protein